MRLGFFLPQISWAVAGLDGLAQIASRAEGDRFATATGRPKKPLFFPTPAKRRYPVADGVIPAVYKTSLEPLERATFVAGQTSRIGLGVSVNLPWYNPALLARRLTTIDVLSRAGSASVSGSAGRPRSTRPSEAPGTFAASGFARRSRR